MASLQVSQIRHYSCSVAGDPTGGSNLQHLKFSCICIVLKFFFTPENTFWSRQGTSSNCDVISFEINNEINNYFVFIFFHNVDLLHRTGMSLSVSHWTASHEFKTHRSFYIFHLKKKENDYICLNILHFENFKTAIIPVYLEELY